MAPRVRTGLDVLAADGFRPLLGRRVGLVAHPASVDGQLRHAVYLMESAGVRLATLFGPEHGFLGQAQDLIGVADAAPERLRVVSLYGATADSLRPTREQLGGLDVLVIDLQDVGSRFYTFQATMLYCLESAAAVGLNVLVLDRPNPLGGVEVEGPTIRPGYGSFVGAHPLPIRHGVTIGELARLYRSERRLDVDLTVVPCDGWSRPMDWEATGLPWVLPSPNMPTVETALVYPGQCLVEGTNQSEGRGTTRPFEICGGPGIDPRHLAARLNGSRLPGVTFRPTYFQPTFQKHANTLCGGVQVHVTDRPSFRPVRTGLAVLAALREAAGDEFAWRTEPYEFVREPIAIDLLFGSDRERLAIDADADPRELTRLWAADEADFRVRRRQYLAY